MKIISKRHFLFPYCSPVSYRLSSCQFGTVSRENKELSGCHKMGFSFCIPHWWFGTSHPITLCLSFPVKWGESIFFLTPSSSHSWEKRTGGCDCCCCCAGTGFSVCRHCQVNSWCLCRHWFQIPHLEPFLLCSAVWQKSPFTQPSHGLINSFKT